MIDEGAFDRFSRAEVSARATGRALVEVLDERDLLLTMPRLAAIRIDTLTGLYRALDEAGVARLLAPAGTSGSTPEAAFRAVLDFIEKYARSI